MHRRKPFSAKQRKEQLQLKRAVKRGDVPAPPPSKPDKHRRARRGPTGHLLDSATRTAAADSSRRLESSFVKLPPAFLEKTRVIASRLPLQRPIPSDLAILPDVDKLLPDADPAQSNQLTCPKRPKWRYDMSKKELEANEEGLFKKWLVQTDAAVTAWCTADDVGPASSTSPAAQQASGEVQTIDSMPHAPTSFERNLEVWRQIWRVTEISQILLILLDSRCPILHFPPALSAYLASVSNASRLRIVLVLTKVDISGPDRAAAWSKYLNALYPGTRVVQVESYTEKPSGGDATSASRKRMHEPHLPSAFRQTLVDALRETHAELLEPPSAVKNNSDRLASWKPRIKAEVDWEIVLKAHGGQVGTVVGGAAAPKPHNTASEENAAEDKTEDDDSEPEVLTIGLIGQPNVGKSSLLNALFGTQKVRASRTPGKTKHFQTLFWTSEVRLVDCPGLVIPNYVPMETQVLSGILPISRVSAVPLCIYHAARLLPLERILGLTHPSLASPPAEDKRTWREGMRPHDHDAGGAPQRQLVWTAMDILIAYANKKGWVTAKAGRPDVNRAGNASA
ncbi:P-loop containing nucleoside triphosphate hydrolase protein [Daedaleopsis nitida]|nr:P-loop containing nucleoside triphosphate hydrolase protein [Daedaleopsis nitida]